MLRKNISLTSDHIKMLEPYIEEHDGNISAAVRSVIELSCRKEEPQEAVAEDFIQLPLPLLRWLIENSKGLVPGSNVIKGLMCEMGFDTRIPSIDEVADELYRIVRVSGIPVDAELREKNERNFVIKFKGSDPLLNAFVAMVASLIFSSLNPPYRITKADEPSTLISIHYEVGVNAHSYFLEHFGYKQPIFDELNREWEWWRWVVDTTVMLNYRMLLIAQDVLEGLLQGKGCPGGIAYIERKSGKYYREIPFDEFFLLLREEFKNASIVEDMSYIEDKGEILVYHSFSEPVVIERIAEWLECLIKSYWKKIERETSAMTTVIRRID